MFLKGTPFWLPFRLRILMESNWLLRFLLYRFTHPLNPLHIGWFRLASSTRAVSLNKKIGLNNLIRQRMYRRMDIKVQREYEEYRKEYEAWQFSTILNS